MGHLIFDIHGNEGTRTIVDISYPNWGVQEYTKTYKAYLLKYRFELHLM